MISCIYQWDIFLVTVYILFLCFHHVDFTVVPDSAPVKQSVGGKKPVAHAPSSDSEEYTEKESEYFLLNCSDISIAYH